MNSWAEAHQVTGTPILNLQNSGFKLFPNPAENWVKVQSKSGQSIKTIQLYNLHGQLVFKQTFAKPLLETEISLQNLPKGVYKVQIENVNNLLQTIPLILH